MQTTDVQTQRRLRSIRLVLGFFVVGLVLSGLTAFPLRWELRLLTSWFGDGTTIGSTPFPACRIGCRVFGTAWRSRHANIRFLRTAPIRSPLHTWQSPSLSWDR